MRVDVLTLFPELINDYANTSILGLAQERGLYSVHAHNPRDYSLDKHRRVDDTCYGGGAGMLLAPQPCFDCLEAVLKDVQSSEGTPTRESLLDVHKRVQEQLASDQSLTGLSSIRDLDLSQLQEGYLEHPASRDYEIIITSPSGRTMDQELAIELSTKSNLVILCGRYEGFDQRIRDLATMEVSVGDYVLTGGELPALTIMDSVLRLIPGVVGDADSITEESFSTVDFLAELERHQVSKKELSELMHKTGIESADELRQLKLLEYPQYTRPADFRGKQVPEILESGDHKKILLWRLEQAIKFTRDKRKDILEGVKS